MDKETARRLLDGHGKPARLHEYRLVGEYDDETGDVPGVTRVDMGGGTLILPDELLAEARAVLEADEQ